MLTEQQQNEIREHLEKAQNPLFYFDNDADGLCSFILLRRYIGRGKGVAVRSYPDLNAQYAKKTQELNADYVFILDKPVISNEFLEELDRLQIPTVWIDHHDVENTIGNFSNLYLYNPAKNKGKDKSYEPVTYLSYKITNRKEDIWIAVMGCIADHHMPDFYPEFNKAYPEYGGKANEPFDVYYKTEIGKIAQALNFGLKDSITHVVQLQNFLISCKGPEEVFSEATENKSFRAKYSEIRKRYSSLLEQAKETLSGNLIFFEYGGELSISSDISNELSYMYPNKYIVVVYTKGNISNVSLRGKDVKSILSDILKSLKNASGGGHDDAVGARIRTEEIGLFKEEIEKRINKK